MSDDRPSLPTDRAFIVQIHADAGTETEQLNGRVEHVVSGHATHFQSTEELLGFIVRMLSEAKP